MTVANWPRGRIARENAKEEAPHSASTSTLAERHYKHLFLSHRNTDLPGLMGFLPELPGRRLEGRRPQFFHTLDSEVVTTKTRIALTP